MPIINICCQMKSCSSDCCNAWFPFDRNGVVKSCDSSSFWIIGEKLKFVLNYWKPCCGELKQLAKTYSDSTMSRLYYDLMETRHNLHRTHKIVRQTLPNDVAHLSVF